MTGTLQPRVRRDIEDLRQRLTKSPYLFELQAGEYLGVSRHTLQNWRIAGDGPEFRRHGGRVMYHVDDLDAFSSKTRCRSTSDQPQEVPASTA